MNSDILVKALEEIRDTAKSWEGRAKAPYWDLGYKADAALKRFNTQIHTGACCDSPGRDKCEQCQEIGSANPNNH